MSLSKSKFWYSNNCYIFQSALFHYLAISDDEKCLMKKRKMLFFNIDVRPTVRVMENISSNLTTYAILGLEPGESYKIELGTKTGNVPTRQSITGAPAL